jgi:hypothetical protein
MKKRIFRYLVTIVLSTVLLSSSLTGFAYDAYGAYSAYDDYIEVESRQDNAGPDGMWSGVVNVGNTHRQGWARLTVNGGINLGVRARLYRNNWFQTHGDSFANTSVTAWTGLSAVNPGDTFQVRAIRLQ